VTYSGKFGPKIPKISYFLMIYHLQKTACPRKIWLRRYASPRVREIVKNRIYYLQEPFSTWSLRFGVLAFWRKLTTCSSSLELSSYQISDRLDKNSRLRDLSKIAKNEHFLLIISLYQAVYGLLNLEPKGQRPKALNQRSRPKVHLTWLVLRAFTLLVVFTHFLLFSTSSWASAWKK